MFPPNRPTNERIVAVAFDVLLEGDEGLALTA